METTITAKVTDIADVAYDIMTMLTNKLQCAAALGQYRNDAHAAGEDEVLMVYQQVERHAREDITALRDLLRSRI